MKSAPAKPASEFDLEAGQQQKRWASRMMAVVIATVYLAGFLLPFRSGERLVDIDGNTRWSTTHGYEVIFALGAAIPSGDCYLLFCNAAIWITNLFLVCGLVALMIPRWRIAFMLGMAAFTSSVFLAPLFIPIVGIVLVLNFIFEDHGRWGLAIPCWVVSVIAVPLVARYLEPEM